MKEQEKVRKVLEIVVKAAKQEGQSCIVYNLEESVIRHWAGDDDFDCMIAMLSNLNTATYPWPRGVQYIMGADLYLILSLSINSYLLNRSELDKITTELCRKGTVVIVGVAEGDLTFVEEKYSRLWSIVAPEVKGNLIFRRWDSNKKELVGF